MKKQCSKCLLEKPINQFHNRNNIAGYQDRCKKCACEKAKEYYYKYSNEHKDRATRRRLLITKIISDIKEKYGCCECGIKIVQCLDFHHVSSTKDFNIAELRNSNIIKLIEEINKCCVLCSNHHRMFHSGLTLNKNFVLCCEDLEDIKNKFKKLKPVFGFTEKIIRKRKNFTPKIKAKKQIVVKYKAQWPTKDELKILVWEKPTSQIARELGVSDNAVAKMCKKHGIEKPARGYWAKKYAVLE